MKFYLFAILLIPFCFISCNTAKKKGVDIEMYKKVLVVNHHSLSFPATYNDIVSILGVPPKKTYNLNKEPITTTYLYEEYGIAVEELDKKIFAITVIFFNPIISNSPYFSGKFTINDVSLDFRSSLEDLNKIPGLIIEEELPNLYVTKFNEFNVLFEFIDSKKKGNLKGICITNKNLKNHLNHKGWSQDDISRFKKETKETEGFIDFCKKRNIDLDKFADCYTDKITSTFTIIELKTQAKNTKEETYKIFEDCVKLSR